MLKRVRKTIADGAMLEWGNHVLVAVSGGPDSVALLRMLVLISCEYDLRLTTAHLNHGLRGAESQAEEAFVHRLCAGMGINCISKTVDVRTLMKGSGKSLEEICREQRYRFLDETAKTCGAKKIATGHHRDDQAETVLINFLRGSGLQGLKGIVPVREGRIIRPLLHIGRKEILEFLGREGLPYTTDSSNESLHFLRNRIRHQLIPELAARYNPAIVKGLSHTAEIIRREDDYLQTVVRRILNGWGVVPGEADSLLPMEDFSDLHEALQGRVIKCLLASATPSGNGIGHRHVEAVLALTRLPRRRKASLDLPGLIRAEKDGNSLSIRRVNARPVRSDKRKGMRSET
jgi:tRNA(Ile)-lysidine synthase